jgi:hypothetical protein
MLPTTARAARALVLQIDDFLERPQARERLEAVHRDADVAPAVVDALIALEPRVKALRSRSRLDEAPPMDQKTGENHEP